MLFYASLPLVILCFVVLLLLHILAPPLILPYHNGQVLAGNQISIYITWYGRFSKAQKSTIMDFLASFKPSKKILKVISSPS
ncbi:unnamed protein product, partial [Sphagnum troendelagicum]